MDRHVREVYVRSQEEVAQLMRVSQVTVARLERRAFYKLRRNPEAWYLLRHICRVNSARISPSIIEVNIWREMEQALELIADREPVVRGMR